MHKKTLLLGLCATGLSISAALGFSTDPSFLTRSFGTTSVTTNAPVVVTATFTNGAGLALRGFCFSEQIPSGLNVTMLGLTLNGQSVANYTFETGLDSDVYPGCTPYRWVLESPPGFTENNPVPVNASVQVQYSVTSPAVGSFNLQQFSWAGYDPVSTNASFGYSESSDAQLVSFNPAPPPSYPILATAASGMSFSTSLGTNPPSQMLGIANGGSGTLNWTVVADGSAPAWLAVSPANGVGNGIVTVSVASASLAPGTYSKNITVTAVGATNSPQIVGVSLTVNASGLVHYDFTYPNRASLVADGWDFLARTASGATRNTEQSSGAVVAYDQMAHPGVLRIPADAGDLWATMNNTRNSVFRDVGTNWTSLRLKMSFAPTQNYQQAGLAVYQDDDNYVFVDRIYNGGNKIACSQEGGGAALVVNAVSVTATTNLYLRLDRAAGSGPISASYSLDGTNWVVLGSATQTLRNPRLGIIVGSSPGGFPNADITWAEVVAPQTAPMLAVSPGNLTYSAAQGSNPARQVLGITNSGGGTLSWRAVTDGSAPAWLTVSPSNGSGNGTVSVTVASASLAPGTYSKSITVTAVGAISSPQTVVVNLTVTPVLPNLAVNPTVMNFGAVQGTNPPSQMLGVTNSGNGTLSWTVVADGNAPAWLAVSPTNGVGNATVTVNVNSAGLAAGSYSKNLTVTAVGATNSPQTVIVNLTVNPVLPNLAVNPTTMNFAVVQGTNPPPSQMLGITNSGTGTLSWTVVADGSAPAWLAVSPTNGTDNAMVTVSVNSAGLAAGSYSKNLTVTSVGATNSPQTVVVNLTVNLVLPNLTVNPMTMNFAVVQGTNPPPSQMLGITNSGSGTLNWTVVADGSAPAWLIVSPTNGVGNAMVTVSANTAGLAPGSYSKSITVSAAGATNSSRTVTVSLTVNASGLVHYDFTYPNRASLVADGWDFLARTASGATRNTEQGSGAVVSYDQVAHPGVLRIPADAGDLWATMNNTRNSVFRDVGTNWTSLRLKLNFAPTQNYQQAGLAAYQDDDNYVFVDRIYNGGNKIACSQEVGGAASVINVASVTATTNLYLRLDRAAGSGPISVSYSLDGTNWVVLGSATQTLSNPRLGIIVGSSPGGFPNADITWAEVVAPQTAPMLAVSPGNLTYSAAQGSNPARQVLGITNSGGGTLSWRAVTDGSAPAWLTVSPSNGSGNGAVNVSVASVSLAPGTYSKSITVTAVGATNSPQTVAVNLTVTPVLPNLVVNPTTMNFAVAQGTNPPSQVLGITNNGNGTLSWTAVADGSAPAWLAVSPTNGVGNAMVTVSVSSAGLAAGSYSKNLTVTAVGATNSPQTVVVILTVYASGMVHYDFTYPNRASLVADGWDLLARTASGATRNTEQSSGAVVSYDQVAHPGVLRIPADAGDLWAAMNNTRNSVFRDVGTNWTSLRLKLSFAPTQNYQQAGLAVYQDDDNYVFVDRIYNGGNKIACSQEVGGAASVVNVASVTATTNLYLRLDRAAGSGVISESYSLDGTNWVLLGSATQMLSNPRLGIIVGSSPGGFPNADINWAEVVALQTAPMLALSPVKNVSSAVTAINPNPVEMLTPGIANGKFGFEFETQLGASYVVEYKDLLSDPSWSMLTNVIGTGSILRFEDPTTPGASRFYRVRVP